MPRTVSNAVEKKSSLAYPIHFAPRHAVQKGAVRITNRLILGVSWSRWSFWMMIEGEVLRLGGWTI